jgi:hypothetical protein
MRPWTLYGFWPSSKPEPRSLAITPCRYHRRSVDILLHRYYPPWLLAVPALWKTSPQHRR